MSKMMRTVLLNIADTHCGSSTGIMVARPWQLNDGGEYRPSQGQRKLWGLTAEICQEVRRLRLLYENTRIIVVHNGDANDGNHHGTPQLVTSDTEEQERIHLDLMDEMYSIMGYGNEDDRTYYTAGTRVHVGSSEHRIAMDLGAVPFNKGKGKRDGEYAWPRLPLDVNGCLFDFAHHGFSPGNLLHTRGNAIRSKLKSMYYERLELGVRVARYYVSAHNHQYRHEGIYTDKVGVVHGIISPALQGRTHYVNKVAARNVSDLGMLVWEIEIDGTDKLHDEFVQKKIDGKVVKP